MFLLSLGNYGDGSWLDLENNNLTRFDSNVFQPVLEKMRLYGRLPFASIRMDNSKIMFLSFKTFDQIKQFHQNIDPIDCDADPCHISWLIRDKRLLIENIFGGSCSNGTSLNNLDEYALDNCPKVIL